jgi:RNA polymerase sigma-70 factor (ECF subfamily)
MMQAQAELEAMDECALLVRCQQGDRTSFDPIVLRYMRRATAFALGWTGNQQDALDLSQEAFAQAFRSIRSFDTARPFFPWYHRILKNLCLNHIARAARRQEVPLVDEEELEQEEVTPELHAEREELRRQVWQALRRLEPSYREILILREFQQLTYAELATVLEIPRGTVMSRLHEARQRLRLQLEPVLKSKESRGYGDV